MVTSWQTHDDGVAHNRFFTRWEKYGHDRLYCTCGYDSCEGYIDIKTGQISTDLDTLLHPENPVSHYYADNAYDDDTDIDLDFDDGDYKLHITHGTSKGNAIVKIPADIIDN